MAAYFFASPVDVEVKLDGEDERKQVDMKSEKERIITCPVYYDGDSVSGQVRVNIWSLRRYLRCVKGDGTRPGRQEARTRRYQG